MAFLSQFPHHLSTVSGEPQYISNELLLRLSILLNHHTDVAAGIQRILLLLHLRRACQFAQAGHIFVFCLGESLLQPVDVPVENLGALYFVVERFERGLERFRLTVRCSTPARRLLGGFSVCLRFFRFLLLMLAHGFV